MSDRFTELVDLHYAALYRFAYGLSGNQADACDLTQQTFYLYASKSGSIRDEAKVKSWLFTTLYREFLKGVRRTGRIEPLDDELEAEADWGPEDAASIRNLDLHAVLAALAGLEESHRAPLTLFYMEALSYAEIADVLGVPLGTVMSRIARGKRLLRRCLCGDSAKIVPFPKNERRIES